MKLLLDTHVWLWLLGQPERLNPEVRQSLEEASNLEALGLA